ncbi:portal protein [Klebsiella quasipneumoniae subsp. similipneumoniae]|uniref:portal protein n=1 Tax=Klebsiella quasipneumoniae TaxID=1463165 RepID=UPI000B40FA7A|nr:portal protein [Klebsiella quasipneumoniae]AZJ03787.1 phage tail protein [Klebsiella quasipneumoniae]MDH2693413.1 portal protein [Klebsiella quasipneumoniae]OVW11089.1 phage tail protein [Klebsiella quasipneumoniae subsp. similipneumoniae]OVW15571.1 phage tail protein [Klebsiella quasipneumoniae subsp. similipneumoniae]OVW24066.1 phage tail protein [Klebsiella quasipneumoniae subsp. similipneumoniae]
MAAETLKEQLQKQQAQLTNDRSSFDPHWRELSDFINPRGSRFLVTDVNRDDRRNTKIVDPTATLAARTLSSGMMSGITSPARPWFKLATPDPDMMDYGPVKLWLEVVQRRMNEVFNKSNIYQSLPLLYASLGNYSTGAMAVLEDDSDVIRTMMFPIGSYYMANSARGSVDTCFRKFSMTVRQLVMEFGLNNVSDSVKGMWDSGNYESWIEVIHAVYPNIDRDTAKLNSKNKPVKSVYYEVGGDSDKLLRESGFDEFPIMAPRWEVNGEDVYGSSCPGMIALGQVKALQLEQKRKSQLIDKATNPPMVGPSSLRNQRVSLLPGDITYIDQVTGQDGFKPAYLVNPNTADLLADIQDTRQIINSAYFVDLFMMLQNINTRSMPVEAVIEMKEEKLLMLGPVLERLNDECLNPLIDRTFSIMARKNLLPPPPDVLQGMPLRIEYISVMAQAQKSIGLSSLSSTVGFIGQLAQAKPEALDKLNVDQAIDAFAEMSGVSPTVIVPQEQVEQVREQRAQQQQQQQMVVMGMAAAQGAKTLSEAQTADPSVLTALSNAAGAPAGGQQ